MFTPKTIWVILFYGTHVPLKVNNQEQLISFLGTLDGCMKSGEKKEWKMMYFDTQEATDGGYHSISINASCVMAWYVLDTVESLTEKSVQVQEKMAKAIEKMADDHSRGEDWKKPDGS